MTLLIVFAVVALVLGFLPAALTFALRKNAAEALGLSDLPVPSWVFIAVWGAIYPCIGIAAWTVLASRDAVTSSVVAPEIVLIAGFLQTTAFWFTDSLRATAVTDATGVLLSITAAVVLYQSVPLAVPWLLPWLLWMPVTLILKLTALHKARSTTAAD